MSEFNIGDRVEEKIDGLVVRGIVRAIHASKQYLGLELDDDTDSQCKSAARYHPDGLWLAPFSYCKLVQEAQWEFPKGDVVEAKKGWQPDVFDPEAFREFMRNL